MKSILLDMEKGEGSNVVSELAKLRAPQKAKTAVRPSAPPPNGQTEKPVVNDFGVAIPFSVEPGQEKFLTRSDSSGRFVVLSGLDEVWRAQQRADLQEDHADDEDDGDDDVKAWSGSDISKKRRKRDFLEPPRRKSWFTAGVVVERAQPHHLKLAHSFEGECVRLLLEGDASSLALPKFACVMVCGAHLERAKGGSIILSVERSSQVVVLGVSHSVGFCQEKDSPLSKPCDRLMNCQKSVRCRMHEEKAMHKTQVRKENFVQFFDVLMFEKSRVEWS